MRAKCFQGFPEALVMRASEQFAMRAGNRFFCFAKQGNAAVAVC